MMKMNKHFIQKHYSSPETAEDDNSNWGWHLKFGQWLPTDDTIKFEDKLYFADQYNKNYI